MVLSRSTVFHDQVVTCGIFPDPIWMLLSQISDVRRAFRDGEYPFASCERQKILNGLDDDDAESRKSGIFPDPIWMLLSQISDVDDQVVMCISFSTGFIGFAFPLPGLFLLKDSYDKCFSFCAIIFVIDPPDTPCRLTQIDLRWFSSP